MNPNINNNLRLSVFKRDNCRCVECGRKEDLTVIHIISIDKGGDNLMSNLKTICKICKDLN